MSKKLYLNAEEVAETMGISVAFAYKIMRELNAELKQKGYIVVSGRVNKQYFLERTCYGTPQNGKES
ncbi:MAG: DNA-binding protein [Oscillospiraceae bacterium]|nr:DNA-binding protein [Oscillospiraceae bacterium]